MYLTCLPPCPVILGGAGGWVECYSIIFKVADYPLDPELMCLFADFVGYLAYLDPEFCYI